MMNFSRKVLDVTNPLKKRFLVALIAEVGVLGIFSGVVCAQSASLRQGEATIVEGTVRSSAGKLLKGASVLLEEKERSNSLETKTKTDGSFVFSGVSPGVYTLRAKIAGLCEGVSNPLVLNAGDKKRVDLVLESLTADHPGGSGTPSSSGSAAGAMEFEDKPNFTVAGVTDWNNTGMHGSDVNVRTSEALAKETVALKNGGLVEQSTGDTIAGAPSLHSGESQERLLAAREQVRTMLAKADTANGHRLMGELNERLGDPLEAVREYERAALMDPSEQNHFEWGTELLLHRAEMEKAATGVLACVEQKLARFAQEQPGNALANYYYGVTLWKRDRGSEKNAAGLQQAEALLEKAVNIDPKLGEADLQLGILHSERGDFEQAIRDYKKAIEVNPQLDEAHYRLGSAYKRIGEESKAEQEFRAYEKIEKAETAAIESRRRELRQFLIILKDQPAAPSPR